MNHFSVERRLGHRTRHHRRAGGCFWQFQILGEKWTKVSLRRNARENSCNRAERSLIEPQMIPVDVDPARTSGGFCPASAVRH
jgi:hypothetical protein